MDSFFPNTLIDLGIWSGNCCRLAWCFCCFVALFFTEIGGGVEELAMTMPNPTQQEVRVSARKRQCRRCLEDNIVFCFFATVHLPF
ncbi:MAG: hypothetical protein Q9O24_02555 [Gammaproteobacteria bacterium]|nr:hypothetical protein [Gammaproteobacteria bacterium]